MSPPNQEQRTNGPGGGMGPMGGMGAGGGKAKDAKRTLTTLVAYLSAYRTQIIVVFIFAIMSTVFSIVGPRMLGDVTTLLVDGLLAFAAGTGLLTDFAAMGRIITWLVGLYLFSAVCTYLQSHIMSKVTMQVSYDLRKNIAAKMSKLPLNYYDTRTHGEVLSRVTNDVDMISQTLNQGLTQMVTTAVGILGVLCMMLSISWIMTVAALLVVPLAMMPVVGIIMKSQGFFKDQQRSLGELNGHVEGMYSGHNIVQAFNGEQASVEGFEKINEELYVSAWKSQFLSGVMQPMMMFVGNLGYVVVCILGGWLAVKKVIKIGDIQSFIQYMRSFTQYLAQLATVSNTVQSTIAAAERVFEFLEEEEESADRDGVDMSQTFQGNVTFEHVNFGYLPDKTIIHDFSASIRKGQKVAIVGPTGAGKTTVVKLLMRFYDINSGTIRIDGNDIFDFRRSDLRGLFGMVLQDTWLYNASIMDNIRYGTFDATDEEVIAAAKAAHCDEFIRSLPDGYHMVLNEEASNISQGQKQLFTIARVILADPKMLILDEATSSVDTRTEILIQKAMDHLMKDRTSFVIAHRLSTIQDADLILVMEDGDIREQGNHLELLAQNGFYAELYNSQFDEEEE